MTIFWTDTERETGSASCPLRQATEDDNLSWRACTATWPSSISSWQTPSRDGGSGPTLQSNINRDKAGIYTEYMIGNKYIYKYTLYTIHPTSYVVFIFTWYTFDSVLISGMFGLFRGFSVFKLSKTLVGYLNFKGKYLMVC